MAIQNTGCFVINIKGTHLTRQRPPGFRALAEQCGCTWISEPSREASGVPRDPATGLQLMDGAGQGVRSSWGLCPGPVSLEVGGILGLERETKPRKQQGPACLGWAGWHPVFTVGPVGQALRVLLSGF